MSMIWVKFYPSDWLGGTRGMTASETGIYITLIAMMYERDGSVQDDTARLARICGSSPAAFKKALDVLIDEGKIQRADGLLTNERVSRELKNASELSAVQRDNVNSRWNKKRNEINDSDDTAVLPPKYDGNTYQKPDTRKKEDTSNDVANATTDLEWIWSVGIRHLTDRKVQERQARSAVGKWRKTERDRDIRRHIEAMVAAQVIDPVPWINARITAIAKQRDGPGVRVAV